MKATGPLKIGFAILLACLVTTGCATYHFGKGERTFPGGYDRVAVPMFVNKTQEVGIETSFTQWLRYEFDRGKSAKLSSEVEAQVVLEGTITKVLYTPTIQVAPNSTSVTNLYTPHPSANGGGFCNPNNPNTNCNSNPLPNTAILDTQYLVEVDVHINARKASDHTVLWSGDFTSQRQYAAPLLGKPTTIEGTPGINTAAPLYNQTSRVSSVSTMARDMMSEAHDRITENF